jgi:predicted small integral membrane protein
LNRLLAFLPLALAAVAVTFFSDAVAVRPLWLLVTALHEACHGLMAVALGGTITSFHVNANAGGWCGYVIEPSFLKTILVAGAGYTGSLVVGGLLLVVAARSRQDRWFLLLLGLILLYLAWLCLKSASLFGILFCAGTGLSFIVLARLPLGAVHDFLLRLTGAACAFLSVRDIKDDLVDRAVKGSDGDAIASALHIPAYLVGLAWLGLAGFLLALFLFWSYRVDRGALPSKPPVE